MKLNSRITGLYQAEVEERLRRDGLNQISHSKS